MVIWETEPATERELIMASYMQSGVSGGIFPGGVACIIDGERSNTLTCGSLCPTGTMGGEETAYRNDTVLDMASITKVAVTLPCVLLSVQYGKLQLSDTIGRYLPELLAGSDSVRKQHITIEQLLTHTSGLPAWRPYFVLLHSKQEYLEAIASEPLERDPGNEIIYSDLGFMLLGWLLERIWNDQLDRIAQRLLFEPLGMSATSYKPHQYEPFGQALIAPTERGNEFERGMSLAYIEKRETGSLAANSFRLERDQLDELAWRSGFIVAEVHDANCHYGLGGISGHAGLFSTIADMRKYLSIWRRPSLISAELCRKAATVHAESGTLKRGLGWEVYDKDIYGHTGFTGTTVWHHTGMDVTVIVLTNRIHPVVKEGMNSWRSNLRNALFSTC